jgi:hypothetical protein
MWFMTDSIQFSQSALQLLAALLVLCVLLIIAAGIVWLSQRAFQDPFFWCQVLDSRKRKPRAPTIRTEEGLRRLHTDLIELDFELSTAVPRQPEENVEEDPRVKSARAAFRDRIDTGSLPRAVYWHDEELPAFLRRQAH